MTWSECLSTLGCRKVMCELISHYFKLDGLLPRMNGNHGCCATTLTTWPLGPDQFLLNEENKPWDNGVVSLFVGRTQKTPGYCLWFDVTNPVGGWWVRGIWTCPQCMVFFCAGQLGETTIIAFKIFGLWAIQHLFIFPHFWIGFSLCVRVSLFFWPSIWYVG